METLGDIITELNKEVYKGIRRKTKERRNQPKITDFFKKVNQWRKKVNWEHTIQQQKNNKQQKIQQKQTKTNTKTNTKKQKQKQNNKIK